MAQGPRLWRGLLQDRQTGADEQGQSEESMTESIQKEALRSSGRVSEACLLHWVGKVYLAHDELNPLKYRKAEPL